LQPIAELERPTPEEFRSTIVPRAQPAVFRGLAAAWPLVAAGRDPGRCMAMLAKHASD
jgi:hypothetical protein